MVLSPCHSPSKGTRKLAVVHDSIIDGAPATIVIDADGTFLCFDRELDPERDMEDYHPICLGCLIDRQPGIGRGLELARRHGRAQLVEGTWQA